MPKKTTYPTRTSRSKLLFLLLTVLILLFSGCELSASIPAERADTRLVIQYIDVGQADAELLLLPDGKNMLIDAGGNETADEVVKYIRGQGVERLDYVVATHPHADHIGGMDKVLEAFDVGDFYMPRLPDSQLPTTRTFEDMLLAMDKRSITPTEAKDGVEICSDDGLSITILSPTESKYEDLNHYSAVVLVRYGNFGFLFMGDAEKENEKAMLKKSYDLDADVLKVGHHGSRNASSKEFLKAVSPDYAVITCGADNSYGHPHSETLKRLQNVGAEILRTDQLSTIIFSTDGKTLELQDN